MNRLVKDLTVEELKQIIRQIIREERFVYIPDYPDGRFIHLDIAKPDKNTIYCSRDNDVEA